ncbi:hypothetical protein KZX47_05920 [Thermus sp. SYSU G05001]|uniref:DUF6788 domain-containing protein n=1 Tax=Thermus brevis TaxID=2862456 RepID=A0ABS6ZX99_9DEIN|nr:hypothetical protein [Thermus brevis]MBW6394689.1 hypothetical protein [Thermus brevis]
MQRYHHLLPHLQTLLEEARFLEKRIREEREALSAMVPLPVYWRRVKCGKDKCRRCPHGPYPYTKEKVDGKWQWKYLGKGWQPPEGLTKPEVFRKRLARYRRLLERLVEVREKLAEVERVLGDH